MLKERLKTGTLCHRTDDSVVFITAKKNNIITFVRMAFGKYSNSYIFGKMNLEFMNDELFYKTGYGIDGLVENPSPELLCWAMSDIRHSIEDFNTAKNKMPIKEYKGINSNENHSELLDLIKAKRFIFERGTNRLYYICGVENDIAYTFDGQNAVKLDLSKLDENLKQPKGRYTGFKTIFHSLIAHSVCEGWNLASHLKNRSMNENKEFLIADLRTYKDRGKQEGIRHKEGVYYRNKSEYVVKTENNKTTQITTEKY